MAQTVLAGAYGSGFGQVSVLSSAPVPLGTSRSNRSRLIVTNNSGQSVFVGMFPKGTAPATVATGLAVSTGHEIPSPAVMYYMSQQTDYYVIAAEPVSISFAEEYLG